MIVIVILILLSSISVSYIHETKRLNVRRLMSYFYTHDKRPRRLCCHIWRVTRIRFNRYRFVLVGVNRY